MPQFELFNPMALLPFVDYLEKRNISAQNYLKQNHIPSDMVHHDCGMIFKRQAYGFFKDVYQSEDLLGFGFLHEDSFSIKDLGTLGQTTLRSVTLKDALLTFSHSLPTVAEGNYLWLEEKNHSSWIWCRTSGLSRNDCIPDHTTVLVLRELIRLVAGPDWNPSNIHFFSQAASDIKKLSEFAESKIDFLMPATGISFKTSLLSKPLLMDNKFLPTAQQDIHIEPQSVTEKLFSVLFSLSNFGSLKSSDQASEMLGIQRSSLYRYLADEGTSYRHVIERVRYQKAVTLLENSNESILDIARWLGYSNSANFNRAFRRMSGTTPSEYRKISKEGF